MLLRNLWDVKFNSNEYLQVYCVGFDLFSCLSEIMGVIDDNIVNGNYTNLLIYLRFRFENKLLHIEESNSDYLVAAK